MRRVAALLLGGGLPPDEQAKFSLFAVDADDQGIYSFDGPSVALIRRFEAGYGARPRYLTDNYRDCPASHEDRAPHLSRPPQTRRLRQSLA